MLRRGTAYAPGSAELQQAQRLRRSGKLSRQEIACRLRGKKTNFKIISTLQMRVLEAFSKLQTIVFISAARTTQAAAGSVEVFYLFMTAA